MSEPLPAAVVTGATSGIGREVAVGLARAGWRTVVVGRGESRAAKVASEIASAAGNSRVESIPVRDLGLVRDTRGLAATLLSNYPRIGLLVNNAGAMYVRRESTAEGIERTLALDVLAPYLLTTLLADRLRASAPARVVNLASAAHYRGQLRLADLQTTRGYRGFRAYCDAKLGLVLLTRELARQFAGSGVTVNAVHPGFVRSGFGRNTPGPFRVGIRLAGWMAGVSPRRGARTPLFACLDPSLEETSGEYLARRKVRAGSRASRDRRSAAELAAACQRLCEAVPTSNPSPSPPRSGPRPTTNSS